MTESTGVVFRLFSTYCLAVHRGGVIFVGPVAIVGALLYRLKFRHRTGILAGRAAAPSARRKPSARGKQRTP
jgi:hypothetical protein